MSPTDVSVPGPVEPGEAGSSISRTGSRLTARLKAPGLEGYATLVFFLLLYVVFGIWKGGAFASWNNITIDMAQNAHVAFLGAAVTVTLIAGEFDLSVGAMMGMSAVILAYLTSSHGWDVVPAAIVAVAFGLIGGLLNGVLVVYVRLNSFIATLGTAGAMTGVAVWLTKGQTIYGGIPTSLTNAGSKTLLSIPLPVWFAIVLLAVMYVITAHTNLGRYLRAVGANRESARLAGLPAARITILAFVATAFLAAIAGIVFVARYGEADSVSGPNLLLPAFAAGFLGSSVLSPGRFTPVGAIIAAFLLAIATNAMEVAGLNVAIQPVFNGAVLVVAVALTEGLRRRKKRVAGDRDAMGRAQQRQADPSSVVADG